MEIVAKQIAELVDGVVEGSGDAIVTGVSKIDDSRENTIAFLSNKKYTHFIYTTKASVVLVDEDMEFDQELPCTIVRVKSSYIAVATLLNFYSEMKPKKVGVEEPSYISKSAKIGDKPYIGAFAYIGSDTVIGNNVKIYPHAYIGDNVVIGDDTIIYSGVKIYSDCKVGSEVILHSGVVIGADGFGFAPKGDGTYMKIAQVGNAVIEDRVELGANTTVDCATMGSTTVGEGTKLDDLVMIAHNVTVGKNSVFAAQSGVAGSSKVGSNCTVGGQVAISGHITIGDNVTIGGRSGVMSNISDSSTPYLGLPVQPARDTMRRYAVEKRLPEMYQDLKEMKKKMKVLEDLLEQK